MYLFHGSASGVNGTAASPVWTAGGEAASSGFGISVAGQVTMNGDGYGDIVVGAGRCSRKSNGRRQGVPIPRRHRRSNRNGSRPGLERGGDGATSRFGNSVASAGDVNGDGYSDIVVGAPGFNSSAGKAYVFSWRWGWSERDGGTSCFCQSEIASIDHEKSRQLSRLIERKIIRNRVERSSEMVSSATELVVSA